MNAGKRRTYFFDVRQTKSDDYYLTLTESTKRFNGDGSERHKIFLYKEDFNRFIANLEEVINYVKTELMPDYDYEEFDHQHDEWEARENNEREHERPPQQPRPERQPRESRGHDRRGDDAGQWRTPPPPPSKEQQFDDDLSW
jgi:hypothetical protein